MSTPHTKQTPAGAPEEVPPLKPGDHLTRDEFERRYDAMPRLWKAELIEGVVSIPALGGLRYGRPRCRLVGWMGVYAAATPGVDAGKNSTVWLDPVNEFQPDSLLLIEPRRGGQARISADDFIEGAPELVAEVTACGTSHEPDTTKIEVHWRNGVRESIVWRVNDREVD
jgi:Uma2 family endonuclease